MAHDNIRINDSPDDCRVVIDLDLDCAFCLDTDCVGEIVEKLSHHSLHPRVRKLFQRIAGIVS
jgi:hypothetical protein